MVAWHKVYITGELMVPLLVLDEILKLNRVLSVYELRERLPVRQIWLAVQNCVQAGQILGTLPSSNQITVKAYYLAYLTLHLLSVIASSLCCSHSKATLLEFL